MWGRQFDPGSGHKMSRSGNPERDIWHNGVMSKNGNLQVIHDEEGNRFVITVDGAEAGFAAYEMRDGNRVFNHTEVFADFQGMGLSKPLIKEALDETQVAGIAVLSECSAVDYFIEKHPEYKDILA